MATITYFTDRQVNHAPDEDGQVVVVRERIDFTKQSVSAADVVQVLKCAAKTFIHQVITKVITAEGAACTVNVGITGGTADGFNAAVDLNAAANTVEQGAPGTDAYLTAGGYSIGESADTIDFVMGHNTDAAIVDVIVVMSYIGTLGGN